MAEWWGVFGTRRVFVASKLSMAGLLVAAVVAQELSVIIGASMLLGIVTKGTVPVLQTIVVEDVEATDGYEDIFSINTFFRGVTNIITPLLFGWISSLFFVECSYALMAVFSVAAVGPVVLMSKDWSYRPYKGRTLLSSPNCLLCVCAYYSSALLLWCSAMTFSASCGGISS